PAPLSVKGALIGHGWPARPIPLDELRSRTLHPSTSYAARDAVVVVLVRKAQAHGGSYLVGLAGVLLPGLRRAAASLTGACLHKAADLDAEMLTGPIEAVTRWRGGGDRVAARLIWAASRRARALLGAELDYQHQVSSGFASAEPARPWGHPDLVLADAVADGVMTAREAELISATRIGDVPLRELAAAWGVAYDSLQKQRRRAELDVAAWIFSRSPVREGAENHGYRVAVDPGRGEGTGSPRKRHRPRTPRR
ncbi:MAG: hypothetical protein ACRDH5_16705, partial [bacterium]